MVYVFDDPKVAEQLRSLGFFVLTTKYGGIKSFAVEKTDELDMILHQHFADTNFLISPVLCF